MKCKAIELLEVLLEETSEQHGQIYEMVCRDLDETQLKTITKELVRHSVMQLVAIYIYIYIYNINHCFD